MQLVCRGVQGDRQTNASYYQDVIEIPSGLVPVASKSRCKTVPSTPSGQQRAGGEDQETRLQSLYSIPFSSCVRLTAVFPATSVPLVIRAFLWLRLSTVSLPELRRNSTVRIPIIRFLARRVWAVYIRPITYRGVGVVDILVNIVLVLVLVVVHRVCVIVFPIHLHVPLTRVFLAHKHFFRMVVMLVANRGCAVPLCAHNHCGGGVVKGNLVIFTYYY